MLKRITSNHKIKNYKKEKKKNKHIPTFQAFQAHFHTCKHKYKSNDNQNQLTQATWTPLLG